MKAIVQERFGPPDVLQFVDTDQPEIGAGRRAGPRARRRAQPLRLAHAARRPVRRPAHGRGGADQAEAPDRRGRRRRASWRRSARTCAGCGPGTRCSAGSRASFAEYARAEADLVVPKPARLTFEQAAAVPMAGQTALRAIRDVGRGAGRAPGAGQRGRRRRRHLRRPDRGGAGRGGHRGVQHPQRRARPLDRRRPRRRLHRRRTSPTGACATT